MAQIDTSIYNAFAPKVKSIADYDNERMQGQMNQLNLLRGQQEADEYNRKAAEQNAFRTFQKTLVDLPEAQIPDALQRGGYLPQAMDYRKQLSERNAKDASTAKDKASASKANWDMARQHASIIMQNPTPETVEASLQAYGRMTGEDLTGLRDIFRQAKGDPELIKRIAFSIAAEADKQLPKIEKLDNGGTNSVIAFDPLTNRPIATNTYEKTQSPDNAATNETVRRGQDIGVSNVSYQQDARGNFVALPTKPAAGPIVPQPVVAADGKPLQGPPKGADSKPLTESQAKAIAFAGRMEAADRLIAELDGQGTRVSVPGSRAAVIGPLVNAIQGENQQRLDQAKRDFINAVLRRESGAAIAESEFDSAEKQYFPQPGEGPEARAQKAAARRAAIQGLRADVPEGRQGEVDKVAGAGNGPRIGEVVDGYRFRGGNPADPQSWEKAK